MQSPSTTLRELPSPRCAASSLPLPRADAGA